MINAQYIHKIIQGAILMDVGLLKYNQQIVETKRAALLPEQGRLMVDHAHDSAQLVLSERSRHQIEDDVIEAIANHEERIDGTGQPAGKTGAELSELSRFLSVVNYFTLMVSGELTVGQKSFRECFIRCKADKPHFDHRFHELLEPTFRHLLTIVKRRLLFGVGKIFLSEKASMCCTPISKRLVKHGTREKICLLSSLLEEESRSVTNFHRWATRV